MKKEKNKIYSFRTIKSYGPKNDYCHYSGLPSPSAYEKSNKKSKMNKFKTQIMKWYPVGIAMICLLYSVVLGALGYTEEAQYSAHWPGTILLFSLMTNQILKS